MIYTAYCNISSLTSVEDSSYDTWQGNTEFPQSHFCFYKAHNHYPGTDPVGPRHKAVSDRQPWHGQYTCPVHIPHFAVQFALCCHPALKQFCILSASAHSEPSHWRHRQPAHLTALNTAHMFAFILLTSLTGSDWMQQATCRLTTV
jgi:hypothetical protein